VGCVLNTASGCFTPNHDSEAKPHREKQITQCGFVCWTLLQGVWRQVQIFLNTNILFYITRVTGCWLYESE